MPLHGIERADLEGLATEKVGIVRVEARAGGELQRQRTKGLGDPDVRLELPAIRADVQKLVGIVLTQRKSHVQTGSDDDIRLVVAKLCERERRSPIEQHGET